MIKARWISLVFMFALVLEACSIPLASSGQTPELAPSDPENTPESTLQLVHTLESTKLSSTPVAEKFVKLAKEDLARRLRINADLVTLIKAAEMEWLNSALGCPRPGVFYPTGRIPGFQIWFDVQGTEYIYNTDLNGTLILCPELNPHAPDIVDHGPTPGVPIQ